MTTQAVATRYTASAQPMLHGVHTDPVPLGRPIRWDCTEFVGQHTGDHFNGLATLEAEDAFLDFDDALRHDPAAPQDVRDNPNDVVITVTAAETLTDEARRAYVEQGGIRCPYCGSDEIDADEIDADGPAARSGVACHVCDREWVDIYTLSAIKAIDED